jgi:ribosome-binding protein aMBF1 (putative translation factor)
MTHRLRTARETAELTRNRLAAISGVSVEMIRSVEVGRRNPSDQTRARLAWALGVAYDELWP